MNSFENFVICIIFVMFPIMLYMVLCAYMGLKKIRFSRLLFVMSLFSSMYLGIKYGLVLGGANMILVLNIPIILLYVKGEWEMGGIFSIVVVIIAYLLELNYGLLICKYSLYFIFYFIYERKWKNCNFILVTLVIQGFFLAFEATLFGENMGVTDYAELFLSMIIMYIVSFTSMYLVSLGDRVSNLYNLEVELERDKNIKNSLFKLTHEIKNPLAVCKGYIDMMDTSNIDKTNRYIDIIRSELDRSLNIMSDFLEFSKIRINREEIDICSLLDDVYDNFKLLLGSKNIKLDYVYSEEEIYMMGDYNRLKQVMLNLLKNSKEAILERGIIYIRGYRKRNGFCIEIRDTGKGMDRDTLSKIKDMFYTTKSKGSGIGVSLSNEIIKAHNGTLDYESEIGKGTIVRVWIPIL